MGRTQGLRKLSAPAVSATSIAGRSDASKRSIPNMDCTGRGFFRATSRGSCVTFPWTCARPDVSRAMDCDIEIDAIGLKCPLPVLRLQKRLAGLPRAGSRAFWPATPWRRSTCRISAPRRAMTCSTARPGRRAFRLRHPKTRLIPFIFPKIRKIRRRRAAQGGSMPPRAAPLQQNSVSARGSQASAWFRPAPARAAPACCAPRPRPCPAHPPARCRNRSCHRNR
jgi:hypothetical protein